MRDEERLSGPVVAFGIAIVAVAVVLIVVFGTKAFSQNSDGAGQDKMQQYIEELNNRNADIMFYKYLPEGLEGLNARRVDFMSSGVLESASYKNCAYHVLILYDLDGKLTLSPDELEIVSYLLLQKRYHIIYLGTDLYPQLLSAGIITKKPLEGTTSIHLHLNHNDALMTSEGFADDPGSIPRNVRNELTDNQKIVYAMVIELAKTGIYWN